MLTRKITPVPGKELLKSKKFFSTFWWILHNEVDKGRVRKNENGGPILRVPCLE
jgi:hypothetical protein